MLFTHTDLPPYQELSTKRIDGKRWYNTPKGIYYPSVTTVLDCIEKPWLEAWKKNLGPTNAAKETKRCADRGTSVHAMAEKYLNNDPNPTLGATPNDRGMFNQLKTKLNKIDNIRAQEIPLFSDTLQLAGRVDCIGDYAKTIAAIDFKTSNGNKTKSMIFDYCLQGTAYAIMFFEMFDEPIEDVVILIAVENGMAPLEYHVKIDDYVDPLLERINKFHKGRS